MKYQCCITNWYSFTMYITEILYTGTDTHFLNYAVEFHLICLSFQRFDWKMTSLIVEPWFVGGSYLSVWSHTRWTIWLIKNRDNVWKFQPVHQVVFNENTARWLLMIMDSNFYQIQSFFLCCAVTASYKTLSYRYRSHAHFSRAPSHFLRNISVSFR